MSKVINILVDNDSWILQYAKKLKTLLIDAGHEVFLIRTADEIRNGWCCFMLGCIKLVSSDDLSKNRHNLVVHESDLPLGRGFAPMSWQILEGKNQIPICLLEAADEADAGNIWLRDTISLKGDELCDEWRALQGLKTIELCCRFVKEYNELEPWGQTGIPTWYARRRPDDSKLDISHSIESQMDLLRIVDNERYPAFFEYQNVKYQIQIKKVDD